MWTSLVVALVLLLTGEFVARPVIRFAGRAPGYWDPYAAVKFEEYRRRVTHGCPPDILVVGDSTAAYDIDRAALLAALPRRVHAYNLGWPGNFPHAFRVTTLPLLDAPAPAGLVIVSFANGGFFRDVEAVRRSEAQIVDSPYGREISGRSRLTDHIALLQLQRAWPFIRERWRIYPRFEEVRRRDGFMSMPGPGSGVVTGAWPPNDDQPISQDRLGVVEDVAKLSIARAFTMVVVVPPMPETLDARPNRYTAALISLQRRYGFRLLHLRWRLATTHFYDRYHLNSEGAARYSEQLAGEIVTFLPPEPTLPPDARPRCQHDGGKNG